MIFHARLKGIPKDLPKDEIQGVIAMTKKQMLNGLNTSMSLAEIVSEGGQLITGCEDLVRDTRLYPLGTAKALAEIFRLTCDDGCVRLNHA